MAEEELNIILRAIDEASKILKGVGSSAEDLEGELKDVDNADPNINVDDDQVDETLSDVERLDKKLANLQKQKIEAKIKADTAELEKTNSKIEDVKKKLSEMEGKADVDDSEVQALQAELAQLEYKSANLEVKVADGELTAAKQLEETLNDTAELKVDVDDSEIQKASSSVDGLTSKLMGVAGTIGLVDQATKLWEASTQRQTTQFYFGANLGEQKARKMQLAIQDIVAAVPGDDTFMNTVLSGAMAKQTNLTTAELSKGAQAMADYIAGSEMQGKNAIEAQQDLKSYILSGSTAELERSSILSNQIDILKDKNTVQERINALIEAENAEQVAGLSGYDTAANKLTEFQGRIEKAQADLGEMFLPAIQGALDFGLALDDSLGGGLMATIAGLGAAIPAIVTGLSGIGQAANGIKALQEAYKGLALSEKLVNLVEGEGAIARIASALGITTEAAAADGAAVSFWGLSIAEDAALWPILLIAAAVAALIVVVYELGKSFGWWTDVGSMIDAVWAGIQRLWSAFINHPDVQALIEALTQAWDMLSSAVMGVITWIGSFFNVNTGGDFDIVRALIEAIGLAWEALTLPIRTVITIIQAFISAGQAVASGQLDILGAVQSVWNTLTAFFSQILFQIATMILNWGNQIFSSAVSAAVRFVTGIMNNIRTLPSKVLRILSLILTYIIVRANLWVMQAKRGALNLVNGVMNYLKTLPSKALSALLGVLHSITSAGARWVSGVKNQALQVVNGAYNTLKSLPGKVGSALSGVVDRIVKPFRDAYNTAKGWWDKITSLGTSGGGAGFDIEGMIEDMLNQKQGFTIQGENSLDVNIKQELTLNFDLSNVPEGADEATILNMIRQSMTDKAVVKALVNNPDFQSLDQKMKDRIVLKNNRARGV